ncbi:ATP-binding protein [candidate division WOR-3 bacterium]|nr:ATP-binding protein [candidate division WOR-3 bacterium]
MTIAVASGKGGTGKTTVAIALALSCRKKITLLDCDVEEPNAGLFLDTGALKSEEVAVSVPSIDLTKCSHCGECSDFCNFNALAVTAKEVLVFEDLCHSCGGCSLVCPENAIKYKKAVIGQVESACKESVFFVQGVLKVGKAMSPPVIRAVKKRGNPKGLTLIDCPPGTSCPMITAVSGADYAILVTEPTPFGKHDLVLAAETVRKMKIPFGVIINRWGSNYKGVEEFCEKEGIEILMKIMEDRKIAEACSRGKSILDALPEIENEFIKIIDDIAARFKGKYF